MVAMLSSKSTTVEPCSPGLPPPLEFHSGRLPECLNWKLHLVFLLGLAILSKWSLFGAFWKGRLLGARAKKWNLQIRKVVVTAGLGDWTEKEEIVDSMRADW